MQLVALQKWQFSRAHALENLWGPKSWLKNALESFLVDGFNQLTSPARPNLEKWVAPLNMENWLISWWWNQPTQIEKYAQVKLHHFPNNRGKNKSLWIFCDPQKKNRRKMTRWSQSLIRDRSHACYLENDLCRCSNSELVGSKSALP